MTYDAPIPVTTIRNNNFGDALALPLVRFLTGNDAEHYDRLPIFGKRFSGIGSVAFLWTGHTLVWGSGVLDERRTCEPGLPGMEFLAVRGPKTRAHLISKGYGDVPEVYGDPGIFAPAMYFPVLDFEKRYDIGIVCHHSDDVKRIAETMVRRRGTTFVFISTADPCDIVMRRISQCRRICSSSLHGIVVAEAMGIPCSWFRASSINDPFKFYDYFLGSGRSEDSVNMADLRGVPSVDFQSMSSLPKPTYDVDGMLDAFPLVLGICNDALVRIKDYFDNHPEIQLLERRPSI